MSYYSTYILYFLILHYNLKPYFHLNEHRAEMFIIVYCNKKVLITRQIALRIILLIINVNY